MITQLAIMIHPKIGTFLKLITYSFLDHLYWIQPRSIIIPSRKELDQTKDELATVKNELKAKQKVVEQNFPLSGDFDLVLDHLYWIQPRSIISK